MCEASSSLVCACIIFSFFFTTLSGTGGGGRSHGCAPIVDYRPLFEYGVASPACTAACLAPATCALHGPLAWHVAPVWTLKFRGVVAAAVGRAAWGICVAGALQGAGSLLC